MAMNGDRCSLRMRGFDNGCADALRRAGDQHDATLQCIGVSDSVVPDVHGGNVG
jgi:hypothetical protein